MKILWINPLFPFPLYSGGQVRAYHLIKNLALKNQITLFSFLRPNREQGPTEELEKFCYKVKTFRGRKTWSGRNVFFSGFSRLPFTVTHFYGLRQLSKEIKSELKKEKYDLIHFESFYTSPYIKTDFQLPVVLGNENIEHIIYQRFVKEKNFLPLKLMLQYDVWKMKHYEEAAWKKVDLNLAVSEIDARIIEKISNKKCAVIPNGVDLKYFESFKVSRPIENRPDLLFVGDFKYFANQDALNILVKEIWPLIKQKLPQAKLWLVGKNPGRFATTLKSEGVVVDSSVKDIRQAFSQADLMLAPMRLGSGTSLKVIEAMASGLPVVSTSVGVEGIKVRPNIEAIVCDQPNEFAQAVVKLIKNENQRRKLGQAGKNLIKKHYDWSKISQKLNQTYEELLNEKNKN